MSEPTLKEQLEAFGAVYLSLLRLVAEAEDCQWQAGRTSPPRIDTTERAIGMVNDPTANTVADARRLLLRAAVVRAETALESAMRAMASAERKLEEGLTKWQGE